MAGETPADLAYAHAKENIAAQRLRLDNVRTRATALVTAAAVLASFLGGQALADTKRVRGDAGLVADRSLQWGEAIGIVGFIVVLSACAWIISPKFRRRSAAEEGQPTKASWKFRLNPVTMLAETDDLQAAEPSADGVAIAETYKRSLAEYMQRHWKDNEPKVELRFKILVVAVIALGIEAIGFTADLVI